MTSLVAEPVAVPMACRAIHLHKAAARRPAQLPSSHDSPCNFVSNNHNVLWLTPRESAVAFASTFYTVWAAIDGPRNGSRGHGATTTEPRPASRRPAV